MADDKVTSDDKNVASDNDIKLIAGYPGPALLLNADAKPSLANAKGVGLEKALVGGVVPEIEALIEKSAESTSIANVLARDLTMERNLRTTLVESRQRYKDLVEISSDFSWEVDASGKFIFVSPQGALGY